MNKNIFTSLLLIATILFFKISAAQSYYISPSGNDANAGTSTAQPFKTIQHALLVATPGYTIQVMAGTYKEHAIAYTTGLPGQYITIKNYQNDVAIIDGGGTAGWSCLTFYGPAYFKVHGLQFAYSDSMAGNYQPAISIGSTSQFIEITNCKFNKLWNNNASGIVMYGSDSLQAIHDIKIDSCEFSEVIRFKMAQGIATSGNVSNITITHNLFHHLKSQGIALLGGDSTTPNNLLDYSRFITVSENEIHDVYNGAPGQYRQGIIISGARNCTVERNKIHHCDFGLNIGAYQPAALTRLNVFRNNMVYHNYQEGITMGVYGYPSGGRIYNCSVVNNTFYYNNELKTGTEIVYFPFDSCTVKNNIFYCNSNNGMMYAYFYDSVFTHNDIDYNLHCSTTNNPSAINYYWANTGCNTFGYYKMISGIEAHSIFINPNFVDEYNTVPDLRLLNNSPAIDAGTPGWNGSGSNDFEGQARLFGSTIDMGCDENHNDHAVPVIGAGINNLADENVVVYPNPTTDLLTIETKEPAEILLTDLSGKIIYQTISDKNKIEINLQQAATGLYLLQIKTAKGVSVRKVEKI